MVDSWAAEGCVDPVVLSVVMSSSAFTILDPSKRPIGMGYSIVEAGAKGNVTAFRKLNVPIPMLATPGMRGHVYSVVDVCAPEVATHFKENIIPCSGNMMMLS